MSNNSLTKYVKENFYPNAIVFSTEKAKSIIGKNNLTPAEFLRPFGMFPKIDVRTDTFIRTLTDFRLDFYDSDKFSKISYQESSKIIESVLTDPKIMPELPLYNLKDRQQNYKLPDIVINKLTNFSFPWIDTYVNTIVDLNKFNEFELYQQPLCFIYFCSIDDAINIVKPQINQRDKMPPLIYERIYDTNVPMAIIILNDKSPDVPQISDPQRIQAIQNFKQHFKTNYLLYWEINKMDDSNLDDKSLKYFSGDIWTRYSHSFEKYNNKKNEEKGKFLSLISRKNFAQMIYEFFTNFVLKEIEKKLSAIDRYISENKKGFKNTLFGFLKSDTPNNRNGWNNFFRMYLLTDQEYQEYFAATVYFYFHNYDQSKEIASIFMEDIKKKSQRHYNSAYELYKMSSFLSNSSSKESAFENFDLYIDNKDFLQACRSLFFGIKVSEQRLSIGKLPQILLKASKMIPGYSNKSGQQYVCCAVPIILEQLSVYYLLLNPMKKRKFFLSIIQAAIRYLNENPLFERYSFNDLLFLKEFIDSKHEDSFLTTKDFVSEQLGNFCRDLNLHQGSMAFYQIFMENSKYFTPELNKVRKKKLLDNFAGLILALINLEEEKKQGVILGDYNINDLSIPEIDNTSILIIEEQDYLINGNDNLNFFANPANWSSFDKFDYVPVKKVFLCLTPPDIMALKNLDNIVLNKQNFSNFFCKKKFHINVKNKLYVRFKITNPLPFELTITNMKLIIECSNTNINNMNTSIDNSFETKTSNDILSNSNELDYECENKNITLREFSSQKTEIYVQVFKEKKIIIRGIEFTVGDYGIIKHYFNKKTRSKLYNYIKKKKSRSGSRRSSMTDSTIRNRKTSTSSQHSSHSNNSYKKVMNLNYKEDIICDVIDNNNDINIIFPMGKEINVYKDEFIFMPIKIVNNSNVKIKRFCFYFNDGIHHYSNNKKKDDLSGCCFLNEVIYKEIEIPNDKTDNKNEKVIYVGLIPRKRGEFYLKILFKFEEDKTYVDNEVQRFLVKLRVKESFNFVFKENINQFLPSMTQFQLNSICSIKTSSNLDNFTLSKNIYLNDSYETVLNDNKNWQKTDNSDYVVLHNKFVFNKLIDSENKEGDNCNINENDNEFVIKKKHELLNKKISELESKMSFEEINFNNLLDNVEQKHIKKKLCALIAKGNIIFNWSGIEKNTNKEIHGIYIHKPNLQIPTINDKFLRQLLHTSVTMKYSINKIDDNNSVGTLTMTIDKNIFKEINAVKNFEIYINQMYSTKFSWIGLKKYSFPNNTNKNENDEKDSIVTLEFNCLFKEKGVYDLNQVSMVIYSNIPRQKEKIIQRILSPIMIKIE